MAASYGIDIVAEPAKVGVQPVDIIFVHGLRGSSESTWKKAGADKPWPEALLPKDIPQARIMTFGYDADIVRWTEAAGANRIANHARNLLKYLSDERDGAESEDRPIIFVAHSLGGLVVENALSLSNTSPSSHIKKILECTRGIAFLGTPQCGADAAVFAKVLANFAAYFRPTAVDIVGVLEPESEVLAIVTGGFHELLRARAEAHKPKIEITVFYEDEPMTKAGKSYTIVKRESAILKGYDHYSYNADHVSMTKFDRATDKGYKAIMRELRRWASAGGSAGANPALQARKHWAAVGQEPAAAATAGPSQVVSQGANNFAGATIKAGGSAKAGNFNNANS